MTIPTVDRFSDPLYTQAEAARFLGVPESTFARWTRDVPLVTRVGSGRGQASIPFVGLAEAYTLRAFRSHRVPLQRIRPALDRLNTEFGLTHALASQRLYTDGAEVLFEYRDDIGDDIVEDLVVVRHQQPVFRDVIEDYLHRVDFEDGFARRLPLIGFTGADVFVDAKQGFGQPVFSRGGARLADALGLFRAGEPLTLVAEEFGIPGDQLEAAVRASLPRAA